MRSRIFWILGLGLYLCDCARQPDLAKNGSTAGPKQGVAVVMSVKGKAEVLNKSNGPLTAWTSLFDGNTLTGWKETDFAGHGPARVEDGHLILEMGAALTGVGWTNTNALPKMDYEVRLEAKRVNGSDFFCGLTFPVRDSACTLIVGGWGGGMVGLSSIDGQDASENETTQFVKFDSGRWYRIRLRVTQEKIEAWIDEDKMVDLVTTGRKIGLRFGEIELSQPFGLACWQTTAALRNIQMRKLK